VMNSNGMDGGRRTDGLCDGDVSLELTGEEHLLRQPRGKSSIWRDGWYWDGGLQRDGDGNDEGMGWDGMECQERRGRREEERGRNECASDDAGE